MAARHPAAERPDGPAGTAGPAAPGGDPRAPSGSAAPVDDLDRLIGEIEGEAARRRAGPDFPLAADGRIRHELDRLSPAGTPAAAELVGAVLDARPPAPGGGVGLRRLLGRPVASEADGDGDLAMAVGVALQVLFDRTALARPLRTRVADVDPSSLVATWWSELGDRSRAGRVVCGGAGAASAEERLAAAGYEVEAAHLGGDATAVTAAVAPLPAASHAVVLVDVTCRHPAELADLTVALARVATTVEVLGVAPWWWSRGRSLAEVELGAVRPLSPELWIEELTGAGFAATARYDAAGRSYEVTAGRADVAGG